MSQEIRLNYDDYCQLPDDGKRYEIIDGELYNAPAPFVSHQRVSGNLEFIIREYLRKNPIGEVFNAPIDVLFSNEDIVQPDIIFISNENRKIIKEKNIKGPPDLIIEILSAGKEQYDKRTKKKLYEKYKVKEYWIVDPLREEIEIFELISKKYKRKGIFTTKDIITSRFFPDLKIYLKEVF